MTHARLYAWALACVLATAPAQAQGTAPAPAGLDAAAVPSPVAPDVIRRDEQHRATVRAVRVPALDVDGRLDEAVYSEVPAFGDFIQSLPDEGKPSTEKTEVWVLFDQANFYVSARLWETRPP